MITDYKRPKSLQEAHSFINDGWEVLGGGEYISKHQEDFQKVIDLQELGLNYCKKDKDQLRYGAMTRLQEMVECSFTPLELIDIIKREKSFNIRNAASLAGTLICADGRSDIFAWFICSGAKLLVNGEAMAVIDYLKSDKNALIKEIQIDLQQTIKYERISRTPDDFTIVGVFLSKSLKNNKMTVVINGLTAKPPLIFENLDKTNLITELNNLLKTSRSQISTKWSSYEYQNKVINELVSRLLLQF
jgi:CO/xanthine dehydrogenase FAD-binding subunit